MSMRTLAFAVCIALSATAAQAGSTGPDIDKVSSDIKGGRHSNGVIVGWADGHAGYIKSSALAGKKGSAWCDSVKSTDPWACSWQ